MAGYEAGRATCLRSGMVSDGRRWLEANQHAADAAFVAGYEWALFDYADANGLPAPVAGAS